MSGMLKGVVKVRVIGDPGTVDEVAARVVNSLEASGYEIIEWSKPFPVPDDAEKRRVYVTAYEREVTRE